MRIGYAHSVIALAVIQTASIGCSKKKSKNTTTPVVTTKTTTYSRGALNLINMSQSFTANTPNSFRISTSFNVASATNECNSSNASDLTNTRCEIDAGGGDNVRDTEEFKACVNITDFNCRFFQPSPTNIRDILADFDQSLNGTIEGYSEMYAPCFDSTRTTAGTFDIMALGGSVATAFNPFALITVPLKSTFKNSYTFDSGMNLNLSCVDNSNDKKRGFGFKDGVWSLYQEASSGGVFGTNDAKDNIDIWYALGDSTRDAAEAVRETEAAAAEVAVPGSRTYGSQGQLYPMSTTLANIISRPEEGIVGISLVGAGVGPACGSSLIMNNKTAYFKGNINSYGACSPTDYALKTDGTPAYSASGNVDYCLDVSGGTPTHATMQACYDSGLLVKDDSGVMIDPFITRGLKLMTADMESTAAGVLKARAWMGSVFMKGTDLSQIAPLGGVPSSPAVVITVTGYSAKSRALERTTAAAKQATAVTALCSATTGNTATLAESFEFTFASLVADAISNTPSGGIAPTAAQLLTDFNLSMANTGDVAAYLEIPLQRTRGTTYRGNVEGTATITLDTGAIDTETITIDGTNTDSTTTLKVPLTGNTFTNTSILKIDLAGTLTLNCDNGTVASRTVVLKPGLPRIVWYGKEKLQSSK